MTHIMHHCTGTTMYNIPVTLGVFKKMGSKIFLVTRVSSSSCGSLFFSNIAVTHGVFKNMGCTFD